MRLISVYDIIIEKVIETRGVDMSLTYSFNKLWKILIDRGMKKEQLKISAKLSPTTIAAIGNGEGISSKISGRICTVLQVQPRGHHAIRAGRKGR